MGSLRKARITESEMCRLYQAGAARDLVGMKAGLWDREVCDILRKNGVPLRDDAESRAIAIRSRQKHKSTLRMVKRTRRG